MRWTLPSRPEGCDPAYHLFYLLMPDKPTRDAVMETMRQEGINPTFHYVPLHSSIGGRRFAARDTDCPVTTDVSDRLMRLPFFNGLTENRVPFMPKEVVDIGFKDPLKLAGTGPFQVTEWVTDQKTNFKAHPRYAEFRPNEPYFATTNQIVVPDAASTQAAFISGQTQLLATPSPDDVATVRKAKPDANLYTCVDQNWPHIRMSVDYPPFADFRRLNGDFRFGGRHGLRRHHDTLRLHRERRFRGRFFKNSAARTER